jgi:hypothetical protein
MAIQFDKDRLRRAVVLLLDSRWGPNREQRVREAVGMLPKRTRPFTGAVEALNELMVVAKQKPLVVLDILDKSAAQRKKLAEKAVKAAPKEAQRRATLRANVAAYRKRIEQAIKTEEIRRGKTLTGGDRKAFIEEKKKIWAIRQDRFREEHPELNYQEARSKCAQLLNEEVEQRYERAKQTGAIKASTHRVSNSKLDALQSKFNRR